MKNNSVDIAGLYREYGAMVLRRCRHILKNEQEAMDIMQNVFVQVLRREASLDIVYPSSLLYRIATNLCLNKIRDTRNQAEFVGDEIINVIAHVDEERVFENRSLLEKIFKRNPESTRTIAMLHFSDGMTLEEVALEVGMSVSGVRKRIRALKESAQWLREGAE